MLRRMMICCTALMGWLGMPDGAAAQTAAAREPAVEHWDTRMLDSLAAVLASNGDLAAEFNRSGPFVHLLLRRTAQAEAELHAAEIDLVHIRSGRARLTTGGALGGERREVSPGEWRATSIDGGTSREVGPGDVLMIPSGVPHLWEPVGAEAFVYVIVKVPAPPGRR